MALVLLVVWADYWIAGPILLIMFLCVYPKSYETTVSGLVVRDALTRRMIPYTAITCVTPGRIEYGSCFHIAIAPADRDAFLADMSARCTHLERHGRQLVSRGVQLAWSFA